MEELTKEILKNLGNKHTKVALKQDFKGNYYSYITDTIYIANNCNEPQKEVIKNNINKKASKLVVVCHECIHSNQSKVMHILNTILSNLSIVLTVISIVIGVVWTSALWFDISAIGIIIASIIVRLILELDAINGSIKLALDVVSKGLVEGVANTDIQEGARFIEKYKYLVLFKMILDKIVFLILLLVIK